MKYIKKFEIFEKLDNTIYYHGRNIGRSPYRGNYIFLTDDLGYAISFSDMKKVFKYKLSVDDDFIFSLKKEKDRINLINNVDKQTYNSLLETSRNGEIDWASFSNISNYEYEMGEELLESIGYKGIKLAERPGINSIYLFNQEYCDIIGEIDLTTKDMKKYSSNWFKEKSKEF